MKKNFFLKNFKLLHVLIALSLTFSGCALCKRSIRPKLQYDIKLSNRAFMPKPGLEKKVLDVLKTTKRPRVHALMQFQRILSLEDHRLLKELGISLSYLGANTYAVSIPRGANLETENMKKLIRWAGPFDPMDKLKYQLVKKQFYDWARDQTSGKVKLLVQFFTDIDKETIKSDLESFGIEGTRHGADNSWAVVVDQNKIEQIAALDSVKMIQQGPMPFLPLNEGGCRVANTDEAQQSTFNNPQPAYNKVSGDGIQIGICDSGVDENHNDFDLITAVGTSGASRVYNQRPGSASHGTHVASIAGGNGFNSANNGFPAFSLRGHAPRAGIGDYPSFGGNAQSIHDAIVNDGTDVTNNSYVQSFTLYDAEAESLDQIVRGDATDNNGNSIPARPQVWASGNNGTGAQYGNEEGYYAVFTSAKNTISVGSVDTNNRRLSDYSSLGPTFDGRIKPDLMAPGCTDSVASPGLGIRAASAGTQGYTNMCGTSMAAPVVTGIIALMMEQYQDTYGTTPNLHPSTYKAMLIHTAKDMVKTAAFSTGEFNNPDTNSAVLYHAGPDFATGYGLVDAEAARDIVTKSNQWKEGTISSTGLSRIWCISVPEGSDEIKVVIAWDDEPGSTLTSETTPKLVNDLDLELIDPDGNTHLPWTLDSLPLTTNPGDGARDPIQQGDVNPSFRGADHRNNVEMVNVCLPKAGIWRAVVRGFNLPNGNTQPYSLISSHHINWWCLLPPPPICKIFPWMCRQINICAKYPWICDPVFEFDPIIPRDGIFEIDLRKPFPIDEICKYVLNCPGCSGSGWSYCPGWQMDIDRVPYDAVVTIINQFGEILFEDKTMSSSRTLQLKQQRPGEEYFLNVIDLKGNPYPNKMNLKLGFKPIK
jgi:subtilisin family serine protease